MRSRILLAVATLCLVCVRAAAQDYVWTRGSGPDGGDCRAVAVFPNSGSCVLAAFYRGMHRSTNGGATWSAIPTGSFVGSDLAFGPASNQCQTQVVYAAAKSSGHALQKSTDGGLTWTTVRITQTDPQPMLLSVAVDPVSSQTIYVGASSQGVFRTTNGGADWTPLGPSNVSVSDILIDPRDTSRVIVCGFGGVWLGSCDGSGCGWTLSNTGLGSTDVRALAMSPTNSLTVYAATSGGVYKTVNGCSTWCECNNGLTNTIANTIAVDPSDPNVVLVGTQAGIFRSADAGDSWQPAQSGMGSRHCVQAVAFDPANSRRVIAGTGGSIFRSIDAGATWQMSASGVYGMRCQAIAATPAQPGWLVLGCGTGIYGAGVFLSTDWGENWRFLDLGNEYIDCVGCSCTDCNVFFATSTGGIFRTLDAGTTWNTTQAGDRCYGFGVVCYDPLRAYAGTAGQGVWRTLDGGETWAKCSSGLDWPYVRSLAFNSADPSNVYVGVDAIYPRYGVYSSSDGGDNWSAAQSGVQGIRIWSLAVDPNDGAIYAGSYKKGLYKSTDGGASFAPVGSGLSGTVHCLALDPVTRHVYAGNEAGGVYRSADLGASFTRLDGFTRLALALCVDPNNHNFLYVGTDGDRVWRCSFRSDVGSVAEAKAYPDGQLVRLSNKLVSAIFDGRFYVQEADRSSGIAVISDAGVSVGDAVTVVGTLGTSDGERRIIAASVY